MVVKHIPKKRSLRLGIATLPVSSAGIIPLSNIIFILSALSKNICVITGGEFHIKDSCTVAKIYKIRYRRRKNFFFRIINYIYIQLRISLKLVKLSRNVDLWIFFGGGGLIVPALISKILKKKFILLLTASPAKCEEFQGNFIYKLLDITIKLNYKLSNKIVLYSEDIIKEWNLEQYKNKISIANEYFIDIDEFKIKYKFNERENLVGYIGRLSEEKGVLNFVKAIPEILKERKEIKFMVGGDGLLRDKIEKYLNENNLDDKVKLVGWIPHNELPDYLNKLKLIILPSYTEGLPGTMLEAMACGTPVLATSVGAIPDVIKDGETGFIIKNNNSKDIANDVLRIIEHPDLERITENARSLVESKFTYDVTVENYKKILTEVSG